MIDVLEEDLKEIREYLKGRRMLIYVSGPFTLGDQWVNVRNACLAGDRILELGHYPLIPHLTALWHVISPKPYEQWLEIGSVLIPKCDALLRLPGESRGADAEVVIAREKGLIMYFSLDEIPKV